MQIQIIFSFTISWLYISGQTSFTLQAVWIIHCAARTWFFSQYLLQQQKKKQPPYYLFSQLGRAFTNQAIFLQPLKQKCADNGPQHRFHVLVFTLCFHIYMSGKWEDEIHCLNIISGLEMKTLIKRWIKGQQWGQAARTQTANCLAHYDYFFFFRSRKSHFSSSPA